MQTLVASSDGKGKDEKQAPAFRKLGLVRATRILKARKRQRSIPQGPMHTFVLVSLWVVTCIRLIVANGLIES